MPSSIFCDFPAREYAERYYSYVGDENAAMLESILDGARRLRPRMDRVAEVGGGPSVVPLLALTAAVGAPRHVTFIDIAPSNLAEVQAWRDRNRGAFAYAAVLDWLAQRTRRAPDAIEGELRDSSRWTLCELDLLEPLAPELVAHFDTVSSHFFAESATDAPAQFEQFLHQIRRLCAPGAVVMLSFMRRSLGYAVGDTFFPAVRVDETSLPASFEAAGLVFEEPIWRTTGAERPPTRPGYEGMVFVSGRLAER